MKKNKVLKIVLIVLGALVALLAAAVLGVLFYLHSMAAGIPETLPDAPADSTQVTLTDDEIDKLLSGEITLEELGKRFGISKYYMLRGFKRKYGVTIVQFLNQCRMNYAKNELRFTDKQIDTIAEECGIHDSSYFNRIFRTTEGISAGAYRRQWRN